MTMTIFHDEVFGNKATNGQQGKNIYVKPYAGSDGQRGDAPVRSVKTLTKAQSLATADQNDRVIMYAQSNTAASTTDYQTTTLLWAKDGVHLLGVNAGPLYSQRSRIAISSTGAAGADVAPLMTVSANGCLIENIEIFAGAPASAPTSALGALLVSGDRNVFRNCHIAGCGSATMDAATQFSLKVTGSENLFEDCTFGIDTVARTLVAYEVYLGKTGASATTRNVFRNCRFVTSGAATTTFVTTLANGLQRTNEFINCSWINLPTGVGSGTTLNQAFSIADTSGALLLSGEHTFMGVTALQTSKTAALQIGATKVSLAITNNI